MNCDQTAEAVLWLTEKKGMSLRQIARQMGLTPDGAKSALRRARSGREMTARSGAASPFDATRTPAIPEKRDPCVGCGVRYDRHDELGCKRWRPAP